MRTLLALINEPEKSEKFIYYTANLAKALKSNIHFMHVVNPDRYPLGTPDSTGTAAVQVQQNLEIMAESGEKAINEHVKEIRKEFSQDMFIKLTSKVGIAKMIIDDLIEEGEVHSIAIANKKDESMWVQNPSNMEIIREFKVPVWIVPHGAPMPKFNEIVYATDYKEEDVVTLKKLMDFAGVYKPNVWALHVTDAPEFEEKVKDAGFQETVQKRTNYDKIQVKTIKEKGEDLAETVNEYATNIPADLIVVLKENNNFWERIFKSSSTKDIIKNSDLPVLVFHENK